MTKNKTMVPATHIPKFYPLCPKCGHGTATVLATPHADGYHRRHKCKDVSCQTAFYSLTPYNGNTAETSPLPFKDRALTDAEEAERLEWWAEAARMEVTMKVTYDRFLKRIEQALQKREEDRTQVDTAIVNTFYRLKEAVDNAERKSPEDRNEDRNETEQRDDGGAGSSVSEDADNSSAGHGSEDTG